MVNEINRPPASALEDEALRVRMEASNRNIQSMQQEHQELLHEMERLRQRAADLTLSSAQSNTSVSVDISNEAHIREQQQVEDHETNAVTEPASAVPAANVSENAETGELEPKPSQVTANEVPDSVSDTENGETVESDPETADYLRQKIAEIAAMKAQFKRVQHMVNTTNLIEDHMSRDSLELLGQSTDAQVPANAEPTNTEVKMPTAPATTTEHIVDTGRIGNSTQENEELLTAMLGMFNEFTSDLREQATSLRAERDRLKALKEEILSRRHPS